MTEFEFMKTLADHITNALTAVEVADGRDRYDLPIRYQAEPRITVVGERTATVEVVLKAEMHGYLDRKLTVTINED
jgi:hypothetical protein